MKHGEKSVCMRVCYKSELIESEILSGLKWDPPALLTLCLRQRAANMTEFIKCVIKELKLSVAKHPCTLFQVDLPMIQPAQATGLLLSLHLGISNAALNFLLGCLISGFRFSRHFDIIIFSSGFGSNGFDQPERGWCQSEDRRGRFGNHRNISTEKRTVQANFVFPSIIEMIHWFCLLFWKMAWSWIMDAEHVWYYRDRWEKHTGKPIYFCPCAMQMKCAACYSRTHC